MNISNPDFSCRWRARLGRRTRPRRGRRRRAHLESIVCVSLFYVIDTGSTGFRGQIWTWELPVYPPPLLRRWLCRSTPSLNSLLGAPVDIGAGPGFTVSRSKTSGPRRRASLPGQDRMCPFGIIGVAPRYLPAGAVGELA
jgi:hypothetical protein